MGRGVDMAAMESGLFRKLFSAPAALGIGCLMALASPAGATTTTLLCPFEDASGSAPDTLTVDLDYAAGTITIEQTEGGVPVYHYGPGAAIITDRMITFKLRASSKQAGWFFTIKGSIDRLAGTLAFTGSGFYLGREEGSASHQLRCRPATQKF